jgi:type IV secretory pathway TrbF-like protein
MTDSVWLQAKVEYEERTGSLRKRIWNWQVAFLSSQVILFGSMGLNVWQGFQAKDKPYPILIDALGESVAAGFRERTTQDRMEEIRRGVMRLFVERVRMVSSDYQFQKDTIDRVYSYIAKNTPAYTFLSNWYRSDDGSPFVRSKDGTVSVQVQSVLPSSANVYLVEWIETQRDRNGRESEKSTWKGMFRIGITEWQTAEEAVRNPLGMYVMEVNWTKVT